MSKWTKIGTLRVSQTGKRNLVLGKGVEIFVDGEKIALDKFRMAKCLDATESVQSLLQRGAIDSDAAEQRLNYISDKNIKFDVVIPPATQD